MLLQGDGEQAGPAQVRADGRDRGAVPARGLLRGGAANRGHRLSGFRQVAVTSRCPSVSEGHSQAQVFHGKSYAKVALRAGVCRRILVLFLLSSPSLHLATLILKSKLFACQLLYFAKWSASQFEMTTSALSNGCPETFMSRYSFKR